MDNSKPEYSDDRVKFSTTRLRKRKSTFYGLRKQEKCINIDVNSVNSNDVDMTDSVNIESESASKRKVKPAIVTSRNSKCCQWLQIY